jgi:hypothetical protein
MVPPDPSSTMLHIREAMPADVSALIALDSVAVHDPQRARQISDWQARGGVHVAEWAGQLAGYLVIHHHFFGEAFVEMLMVARELTQPGRRRRPAAPCHRAARPRQAVHFDQCFQYRHATPARRFGFHRQRHRALDEGDPELLYRFAGS